jgi:hypothetical protein
MGVPARADDWDDLPVAVLFGHYPGLARHGEGRANGAIVAQFAMALPSLGLIVAGFFAGPLIERFGPRNAITGALASYALLGSLPWIWNANLLLLGSRQTICGRGRWGCCRWRCSWADSLSCHLRALDARAGPDGSVPGDRYDPVATRRLGRGAAPRALVDDVKAGLSAQNDRFMSY